MDTNHEKALAALSRVTSGDSSSEDRALVRDTLGNLIEERETLLSDARRQRETIRRLASVLHADGPEPVAERVLDIILDLSGAERGFVAVCPFGAPAEDETGEWRFIAARALSRVDLDAPDSLVSKTIIRKALATAEPVVTTDALNSGFGDSASVKELLLRSVACLPIVPEGGLVGFIYLDNTRETAAFDASAMSLVSALLPIAAEAIYGALAKEDSHVEGFPDLLTCSEPFKAQLGTLRQAAAKDVPILLCGPTGSGKTLIARQIHGAGPRSDQPFIHVNSGAIPEGLIEAELFGVTKGAYTGADRSRPGLIEAADGGTLYLDELQALPLSCQVKLLLALEEGKVTRVGSTDNLDVDVRIIASLDRDPEQAMEEDKLRADLYYRLAVIVAHVPPLAARTEDIPLLAQEFLRSARRRLASPALRLGPKALAKLLNHDWPGNVRELQNVLERAALLAEGERIDEIEVGAKKPGWATRLLGKRSAPIDLDEFERVWEECDGKSSAVAARLGIHPKSVPRIRRRLKGR